MFNMLYKTECIEENLKLCKKRTMNRQYKWRLGFGSHSGYLNIIVYKSYTNNQIIKNHVAAI